jgi:hypothetical protein
MESCGAGRRRSSVRLAHSVQVRQCWLNAARAGGKAALTYRSWWRYEGLAFSLALLSLVGGFAPLGLAAANNDVLQPPERCGKLAYEYSSAEYGNGLSNNDYVDPDTHKT